MWVTVALRRRLENVDSRFVAWCPVRRLPPSASLAGMSIGPRGVAAPVLAAFVAMSCLNGCAPSDGRAIAAAHGIPHPALIAHRGASGLAPEETRAAYL